MRLFIICFTFIACFSCKNEPKKNVVEPKIPIEEPATINEKISNLPPLTQAEVTKLYDKVDYIDYLFYNMPFSVSQNEKDGITTNISFITADPAKQVSSACKPIGRIFYDIKGNTYLTADIYFSKDCKFYVFLKDDKPFASALLNADGHNFYGQIIAQADKANKNKLQKAN